MAAGQLLLLTEDEEEELLAPQPLRSRLVQHGLHHRHRRAAGAAGLAATAGLGILLLVLPLRDEDSTTRRSFATSRDLELAIVESKLANTARPWSTFWPQTQPMASLGAGDSIHARGLLRLRRGEGDLCLQAEKGYGSGAFLGPCEDSSFTQQWQFEAQTGLIRHEFAGCLDAGGETLHLWSCDSANPSQQWEHDAATGIIRNKDRGTCLDAQMLGSRGEKGFMGLCDSGIRSQSWGIGVRTGQVELWTGSCLWAARPELGEQVVRRSCGKHHTERWQFTPSTGQLQLGNTSLCVAAEEDNFVRLRKCDAGGFEATQHWTHNVFSGTFRSQAGACLDGAGAGGLLLMKDCDKEDVNQRWSAGVRTGQLQHVHGLCLHTEPSTTARSAVDVVLGACEAAFDQQWSFDDRTGKLQHLDGLCLMMGPKGVSATPCTDNLWGQQWTFDKYTKRIKHGNQCLEAPNPNEVGAKVVVSPCNLEHWKQEWDLSIRTSITALFTVETRNINTHIPLHGVAGRTLQNVGYGVPWQGFKTKVDSYQLAMDKWAKHSPDDIVILTDTDVAYGGCGEEELLRRYHAIVRESGGAPIVTSADANQYPAIEDGVKQFQRLRKERQSVLTSFGLTPERIDQYCARDWNGTVPIALDYAFVNSGFIMGPAKALSEVFACMQIEGWDKECMKDPWCEVGNMTRRKVAGNGTQCCFDDQRALSRCALKHPEKITIDYTGTIMMTTYGMYNMFEVKDDSILNIISNTTQCFVHANCWDWSQPMKWDAWMARLKGVFKAAI